MLFSLIDKEIENSINGKKSEIILQTFKLTNFALFKIAFSILILSSITYLLLTTNINIENLGEFTAPKIISYTGITFMIALIGWMPSPIDLSAWSSIWIMEKREQGETVSYLSLIHI